MEDNEKINVENEDEQGEQEPSDPVPADAPADDGPGGTQGSTEGPGR